MRANPFALLQVEKFYVIWAQHEKNIQRREIKCDVSVIYKYNDGWLATAFIAVWNNLIKASSGAFFLTWKLKWNFGSF